MWEPLNKLSYDLFNRNEEVKEVIKLTDDNVVMLPFAYETKDVHDDIKANMPSYNFSRQCNELKSQILNKYKFFLSL